MYVIIRSAAPAPDLRPKPRSAERLAMEQLEVGDAFIVTTEDAYLRAKDIKRTLRPRVFTIRKVPHTGWQVRRTE